jgi:hypothetical protein
MQGIPYIKQSIYILGRLLFPGPAGYTISTSPQESANLHSGYYQEGQEM